MVWNAEILGICVWTTQATSLAPGSCVQRVRVCRGSTLSVEGKGFHKWPSDLSTRWPRVYPEDQSWSFPWFVLLAIKNAYISQSLEGQNRVRNPSWNVVTVLLIGDLWLLVSTRAELRYVTWTETRPFDLKSLKYLLSDPFIQRFVWAQALVLGLQLKKDL